MLSEKREEEYCEKEERQTNRKKDVITQRGTLR